MVLRRWLGLLLVCCLLSGCVRDRVGITFSDANHGTIVQHLRISTKASEFGEMLAKTWFESLAKQAETLGGKATYPTRQDLVLTIPFFNSGDLVTKFNHLFEIPLDRPVRSVPPLPATLHLATRNFLFWQQHQLDYDIDLRSLKRFLPSSAPQLRLEDFLKLEFSLETPQLAQRFSSTVATPLLQQKGRRLVWQLTPGEINHLEAAFRVPDFLGIGAGVIALLVAIGAFVKVWQSPLPDLPSPDSPLSGSSLSDSP